MCFKSDAFFLAKSQLMHRKENMFEYKLKHFSLLLLLLLLIFFSFK